MADAKEVRNVRQKLSPNDSAGFEAAKPPAQRVIDTASANGVTDWNVHEMVMMLIDRSVPAIPRDVQRIVAAYVSARYVEWAWDAKSSAGPAFNFTIPDSKRPELVRLSPSPNWPQPGDQIDVMDKLYAWYQSTVLETAPCAIRIHYCEWEAQWDEVRIRPCFTRTNA